MGGFLDHILLRKSELQKGGASAPPSQVRESRFLATTTRGGVIKIVSHYNNILMEQSGRFIFPFWKFFKKADLSRLLHGIFPPRRKSVFGAPKLWLWHNFCRNFGDPRDFTFSEKNGKKTTFYHSHQPFWPKIDFFWRFGA